MHHVCKLEEAEKEEANQVTLSEHKDRHHLTPHREHARPRHTISDRNTRPSRRVLAAPIVLMVLVVVLVVVLVAVLVVVLVVVPVVVLVVALVAVLETVLAVALSVVVL